VGNVFVYMHTKDLFCRLCPYSTIVLQSNYKSCLDILFNFSLSRVRLFRQSITLNSLQRTTIQKIIDLWIMHTKDLFCRFVAATKDYLFVPTQLCILISARQKSLTIVDSSLIFSIVFFTLLNLF
jgi:hypothetical protein